MSGTTNICVRIDSDLKAQAESLFSELGMNLSTAITVFIRQAVRENRIPFEITRDRPTGATVTALREAEAILRDGKAKGYAEPDELFRELEK